MDAPAKFPMPAPATPVEVMRRVCDSLADGIDACLCTVLHRAGSAPSTPGQKLVLRGDGTAAGTVGGGGVERRAMEIMQELLEKREGEARVVSLSLEKDLAMSCGGTVQLVIEPFWCSATVLLIGAGHVGFATAELLLRLGFRVVLTDQRPSMLAPERISVLRGAICRVGAPSETTVGIPRHAAVLVATHTHDLDVDAVVWAVQQGFAFVGGVGSRAKAVRVRETLTSLGVPAERAAAVRMPVGVDIPARTPEELAVAIAAELVAWRAK